MFFVNPTLVIHGFHGLNTIVKNKYIIITKTLHSHINIFPKTSVLPDILQFKMHNLTQFNKCIRCKIDFFF